MSEINVKARTANHAAGFRFTGACLAALAVGLGAFGAHAFKHHLETTGMVDVWEKAHLYHLAHALALYALASTRYFTLGPSICFFVGILFFSGSLYGLALSDLRWLGPITPLGGASFIIGWVWLAIASKNHRSL